VQDEPALRGIDSSNVKWNNEGSFLNDAHPDLRADFVIANPPFNDSDWSGELLRADGRWRYSKETPPPHGNANYAWIQHFIYHLNPKGVAGFVLAKGSFANDTFAVYYKKLIANTRQIITLQKLRDTLLPKLISGEVRVKQERDAADG
jgi:type I restriction-modification system DNA methylase subunit